MELNDFNCSLCDTMYNTTNKVPRLLTKCGHTFCQSCLKDILKAGEIKCPEDNQTYENIPKIEDLPRNVTLINLMTKLQKRKRTTPNKVELRESLNIISGSRKQSVISNFSSGSRNLRESVNNVGVSTLTTSEGKNLVEHLKENFHYNNLTYQNTTYTSEFKLADQANINLNLTANNGDNFISMCMKHRRPLEIVCLDHKVRICTSCALFEDHKHHNLRSEEDIMKEVTLKAEILIEYYEIIEKNTEKLEEDDKNNQSMLETSKGKVKAKGEKMKEKISHFFKEMRFLLKAREKQLIEEVQDKYDKVFDQKCGSYEKYVTEVRGKAVNWRKEVQHILDKLNEMSETNDINYDLLVNKDDIIHTAEDILDQIELLSENCPTALANFDDNFDLECNFNLFNQHLDNFCTFSKKEDFTQNLNDPHNTSKEISEPAFFISPSPTKFTTCNQIPTITSASTNFACETSFLSHEDLFMTNSSFSSSKLNNTYNSTALTSDKIVFIKNQLKNEVANFSGYSIGDEGAKKISELLLSSQFSVSPSKRNVGIKVKELKFTKCAIADEGFSHLSNCLEKSNSIHTIILNKNKLKDESYTNILNLIKNNKQLKFLNLALNGFTQGIKEKIKQISKNLNASVKIDI